MERWSNGIPRLRSYMLEPMVVLVRHKAFTLRNTNLKGNRPKLPESDLPSR